MTARVLEARVEFFHRPFVHPLIISSGAITEITEARAHVRVLVGNREAWGHGAMYLSDLWAWPEPSLTHAQRDGVLRELCEGIARDLSDLCGGEAAHPMELGMRLHHALVSPSASPPPVPSPVKGEGIVAPLPEPTPLAKAMCLSPFDAAIHDAVGAALSRSAMALYDEPVEMPVADRLFGDRSASQAVAAMLRPEPVRAFDAWLVVGEADDLERVVRPWVTDRGYRAFKLKILGRDPKADAERTVEVYRALRSFGVDRPRLTADSNGATPSPEAAVEYLERVRNLNADAFYALEYIEQPTGRDIVAQPHDWRSVAALKPVLLDEGLTDEHAMALSVEQGWSGFALKTCKGHSFALAAAAWAHDRGMIVALQDLTNPGLAAIHAGIFAAYVPTINGVELNSAQFTPAANDEWLPRLASFLEPRDGTHRLPEAIPDGLGGRL
jgi:L-alanine-DL-glutamate epimerase-like enolase superfamily enzyme